MTGIRLTFWGAAGQVTGSMHLLEAAGAPVPARRRACSRAAGPRPTSSTRELPFDARRLDGVVLSHAHIDHAGRLPLLVRARLPRPDLRHAGHPRPLRGHAGRRGAHPGEGPRVPRSGAARRARRASRSTPWRDAIAVQDLMVGVPYRRITHLRKHLALEFLDAGHILGSASVDLRITEGGNHRLVFSGDIGRTGLPIIRDPEPPSGPIDTLIIESTYADRDHESVAGAEDAAGRGRAPDRGPRRQGADPRLRAGPGAGAGLHPAPALSRRADPRGPDLRRQPARGGHHHGVPDAPRGVRRARAADRERRPSCSTSRWSRYVRDVADSKALNALHGPAVIIAASRHGGVGPDPAPPGQRHRRPPQPGPLRRLPGGAHAGPPDPERARRSSASWGRSTRGGPRSRPSAATRPTPTATSCGPGSAGWAGRSAGPSWCTARRQALGGDGDDPPRGRGARGRSCRSTARAFDL